MRVRVLALLAALATLAACSPSSDTPDDPGTPKVEPSSTGPADLVALATELRAAVADPDPDTAGDYQGARTVDQLDGDDTLSGAEVSCLRDNGMSISYAADNGDAEPLLVSWVFALGSTAGAVNCEEQMRRTDNASGEVTDLGGQFDLPGLTVYSVTISGDEEGTIVRGLYTANNLLVRISAAQEGASANDLKDAFRDLLNQQYDLVPAT